MKKQKRIFPDPELDEQFRKLREKIDKSKDRVILDS